MIDPAYVRTMARYARWQNDNLYSGADTLSEEARHQDRGAFFKSIRATLNHLLWADTMWMSRLSDFPQPTVGLSGSASYFNDWEALKRERAAMDRRIVDWAHAIGVAELAGDLAWRSSTNTDFVKPRWLVITHMFNHQTHHRGQAHAMITAAGAKPYITDLVIMPSCT
ncbi:DinB family protein [Methylocystis parvus]|uniref:DinB family protein n=1 Tax=Methylocystis parvus TaxID=134 RepID=UPI003C76FB43